MTKDTLKLTSLGLLIAAAPAFAFAGLTVGDSAGITEDEIRAALEAEGAEVMELEFEPGEIEVEYVVNGVEYEAEIDPKTGLITELEVEDDDDDDHDDDDDDDDDDHDENDDEEEDEDED